MADTAKRLVQTGLTTNTETILYTVPGSTTTILRNIRIGNSTATDTAIKASIGGDAFGTRIIPSGFIIPGSSVYDWSGFLVLATAETLRATASIANALTVTVSGVEVA